MYQLLNNETGLEIQKGDKLTTFRGEVATVTGWTAPRHSGSTGHIKTDLGYHYAGVYGCTWHWVEGAAE